jgi:glycosyltransferase involved in cell wall biosynthesis
VRWLRKILRSLQPPILHSMPFYLNMVATWAMSGLSGTPIGSIRGEYRFEAINGYFFYACNRYWPKHIITNSARSRDAALADRSVFRPRNVFFVPNGLDLDLYRPRAHGPCPRPRILGVGNLYPEKRWDRLLSCAAALRRLVPGLDFEIMIVGKGKELERLQNLTDGLQLHDRVTFLGRRYDIPELMAQADVFTLVSDSEGAPNAVMEVMAAGVPVLATDAGDIPRLVKDGVHGFVVPREDEGILVERLRHLLQDAGLREEMGRNARRKALAEFGLDRLVDKTLEVYRESGWSG